MLRNFSFRSWCALAALGCFAGLGFALYLQHAQGYEPCPMCIFQRIALGFAGLFLLGGAVHGPRRSGRWAYGVLALVAAVIGAGIAGRQVWLQHLPPDQAPACGPTLSYLLNMMPAVQVIEYVLKGDGNCAKIDAQWLGIPLPTWTLIAFIALVAYVVVALVATRPRVEKYV